MDGEIANLNFYAAYDGYALGHYGLNSLDYAKLLSARWAEPAASEDECGF